MIRKINNAKIVIKEIINWPRNFILAFIPEEFLNLIFNNHQQNLINLRLVQTKSTIQI